MKAPRLATQSLHAHRRHDGRSGAFSLAICAAALAAALAGCQSQQTNPGDPFLPFMRTRVPPPGTNLPADSYYQGAPATTGPPGSVPPPAVSAPPVYTPPPAGAPTATPSSLRTSPTDKYSPPGGYNLPQSSIDRSKVTAPGSGEVKAGGTAIARRSLAKPVGGQTTVDTQLTADRVSGTKAADGQEEIVSAGALAVTASDADTPSETEDQPSSAGAAVAFADTPAAAGDSAGADELGRDHANRRLLLAAGDHQAPGVEQTASGAQTTLRILTADDQISPGEESLDTPDDRALAMRADGGGTEGDSATGDIAADDSAENGEQPAADREEYVHNTAQLAGPLWVQGGGPAQAAPIDTVEPAGQATTLAMASAPSEVVQASWNEPVAATPAGSAAQTGSAARAGRSAARANQAYAHDPDYGWVRGRLEYSASQRQWKLRYIPIDGATDQFGGSVVLADGTSTQGLRAGDFVTAQGHVVGTNQPGRGFSPRYEVAAIEPVAGTN